MPAVNKKGVPRFVTPRWHGRLARLITYIASIPILFIALNAIGLARRYFIFPAAILLALGAEWWFWSRHIRALQSKLPGYDFALCLRCGYDLRNLPDPHVCPECGEPFSQAEMWDTWTKWLLSGFQFRMAAMTNGELYRKIMAGRSTCMLCSAPLNPPGQGLCASCIKKERIPVPKGA